MPTVNPLRFSRAYGVDQQRIDDVEGHRHHFPRQDRELGMAWGWPGDGHTTFPAGDGCGGMV